MVKTLEIGQSAGLLPKPEEVRYMSYFTDRARESGFLYICIGSGRASTTERVSVNNEGLITLSWLKIQSSPARKSDSP
jgi:hypothetical protein